MKEGKKRAILFRIIKSFEFAIGCVLLFFLAVGYFLVKSVIQQPDYLREVVWEDQFDQENFDYNFATPYENYDVELSLWRPVEDKHRGMRVSVVRQTVSREIIKREGQNEYLLSLHTSGLKPDFVSLTHPFSFTKDYGLDKPAGAEKLSRYTAKIDITKEPVGTPFTLEFIIYSWNAFQGEKNQMFGIYAKPSSEEVVINLNLPEDYKHAEYIEIERYDSEENRMKKMSKDSVNFVETAPRKTRLTIKDPEDGDGYFIRWDG